MYIHIYYIFFPKLFIHFKELLFTWSPFIASLRFMDHYLRTPGLVEHLTFFFFKGQVGTTSKKIFLKIMR